MEILASLLIVAFVAVSILLILTVLIQRPAGGGLSGAFGSGAGSGQTAFGAKTGDALTIATIIMFVIWLLLAVGLAYVTQPKGPDGEPEAAAPAGTTGTDASKQDGTTPASDQPADTPSAPPNGPATPPAEGAQNPPESPTQPPVDQPK